MMNLTIGQIVEFSNGKFVGPEELLNKMVNGVFTDNREIYEDCVFAAVVGARVDGHNFIKSAFDAGAICTICTRAPDEDVPYILVKDVLHAISLISSGYRNTLSIPVICVTGSVGKTSCKNMLACVLGAKFHTLKTPANRNSTLGVPLTMLMVQNNHEAAVIEAGIEDFGEMKEIGKYLRPDIMVYTNIAPCHLSQLGDLDGVLKAKTEILDYINPKGMIIANGDDEKLFGMDPVSISVNAVSVIKTTFGRTERCDVYTNKIVCNSDCLSFELIQQGYQGRTFVIPGYGIHLIEAALPAITVGRKLGLSDEEIQNGLNTYEAEDNHCSLINTSKATVISDCYNSSPKAVEAALTSLGKVKNRKVAIIGSMLDLGPVEYSAHREIGVQADRESIDVLIAVGKLANVICSEVKTTQFYVFDDKKAFFHSANKILHENDMILVKASHGEHFEEIVEWLKENY